MKQTKTYTITITEEELKEIKNDVTLKVMSGKLEFDTTTYIIAKAINNQIMNGGKTKK
jgi:hypothetical protein